MIANEYSRETRNMAAAMYPHLPIDPKSPIDLNALLETADGAVRGIHELLAWLEMNPNASEEEIQFEAYECGKRNLPIKQLRQFFSCIYLMLLAKPDGPRIGLTVRITGVENFVRHIRTRLADPFGWVNVL